MGRVPGKSEWLPGAHPRGWGGAGEGSRVRKALRSVVRGSAHRQCLEGLALSQAFHAVRPPAGAGLFLGRRSGVLSLSCPGWQLLGASCQELPMRSADGRRHGGGKWKLGWGNGDTEASGQQSNSFLSVPLGPGTSWAVLCSWAPSWAPSSGATG